MQRYIKSSKNSQQNRRKLGVEWVEAPDIKARIEFLVEKIDLSWIRLDNVYTYRSFNSSSFSYARIWSMPKVWQMALKIEPKYVIEVISHHFDKLNDKEKDKVLLHEIAHIPKNFSGSLLPHIKKRGKRNFHDKVEKLVRRYLMVKD